MITQIRPSVNGQNLYQRFQSYGHSFDTLLSELIDNPIGVAKNNSTINVTITIKGEWRGGNKKKKRQLDLKKATLEISDDSVGIERDKIEKCLSVAESPSDDDSLNQYGLGLKQSLAQLGTLEFLETKADNDSAYRINEFRIPKPDEDAITLHDSNRTKTGTIIKIKDLKEIVPTQVHEYTILARTMGATYAKFISGQNGRNKKLNLKIVLLDLNNNPVWSIFDVEPESPLYRDSKPVYEEDFNGIADDGTQYALKFKFGYPPTINEIDCMSDEDDDLQLELRKRPWHPYHIFSKQICVLYREKKLIEKVSLYDLLGSRVFDNSYMNYIGEVVLYKGFSANTTKDKIVHSSAWKHFVMSVREKLFAYAKDEYERIRNQGEDDFKREERFKDSLELILKNQLTSVDREYTLDGCGGRIDMLVKEPKDKLKLVWEIKAGRAEYGDVIQLAGYIAHHNNHLIDAKKGILVAAGFSKSVFSTIKRVKENWDISIETRYLKDFGLMDYTEDEKDTVSKIKPINILDDDYAN